MHTHIPRIVTKKRVNACTSTSLIITTHYLHPQVPSMHFTSIWQLYISYIRREALTMYRQLPETVFQMARRLLRHRHLHSLDCEPMACRGRCTTSSSQMSYTTTANTPLKQTFASSTSKTNFASKQTFACTTTSAIRCSDSASRGPRR